jgi:hypothetical protein
MPGFSKVCSCGFAVMMFLPLAVQIPDKPGLVRDYCHMSTHIVLL